ncbi:MAG: NAD/NADP octopine/nopaline dehydrogenase family protein [Firmicutes bacterium]|nr:NAD/NADP octopine/nopaline dehydrogenase family protein [Bacillota bacterium]
MPRKIAILGAGNGGLAAAGHGCLAGCEVRLFNRSPRRLEPLLHRGGFEIDGVLGKGFVQPAVITGDVGEAVSGAELIMVAVPASGHAYYAGLLGEHLTDGQSVLLNPGSTGGALHFSAALRKMGVTGDVKIVETSTLTYICRLTKPDQVSIYSIGRRIPAASFPGKHTASAVASWGFLYPGLAAARNVLETSLNNINAVIHPPGVILNAGRIAVTGGDFYYYYEGFPPDLARVVEVLDEERLALGRALGLSLPAFVALFHQVGSTSDAALTGGTVAGAMLESAPNRWIKAPGDFQHRYLSEDIPYGLVPMAELAGLAGVSTPVVDGLIALASALSARNYRAEGLTLERMGLDGLSLAEIPAFLAEGY